MSVVPVWEVDVDPSFDAVAVVAAEGEKEAREFATSGLVGEYGVLGALAVRRLHGVWAEADGVITRWSE